MDAGRLDFYGDTKFDGGLATEGSPGCGDEGFPARPLFRLRPATGVATTRGIATRGGAQAEPIKPLGRLQPAPSRINSPRPRGTSECRTDELRFLSGARYHIKSSGT